MCERFTGTIFIPHTGPIILALSVGESSQTDFFLNLNCLIKLAVESVICLFRACRLANRCYSNLADTLIHKPQLKSRPTVRVRHHFLLRFWTLQ